MQNSAQMLLAQPSAFISSKFGRQNAPARINDIDKAFQDLCGGKNIQISADQAEDLVRTMLRAERTDRLETLLMVFDLHREDEFDKLLILRREFSQYLESKGGRIDEKELHAFLK